MIYRCELCGKEFKNHWALNGHKAVHAEPKKEFYICRICKKEYKDMKAAAGCMSLHTQKEKKIGFFSDEPVWNKYLNKKNNEFYQFMSENYMGRKVWNSKDGRKISQKEWLKENPEKCCLHRMAKRSGKCFSPNQQHLYEEIKKLFHPYEVILEYPISNKDGVYITDVAIPKLKLIYEHDGNYHDDVEQKEKDIIRDEELKQLGWTVVRITGDYNEQMKCFVRA